MPIFAWYHKVFPWISWITLNILNHKGEDFCGNPKAENESSLEHSKAKDAFEYIVKQIWILKTDWHLIINIYAAFVILYSSFQSYSKAERERERDQNRFSKRLLPFQQSDKYYKYSITNLLCSIKHLKLLFHHGFYKNLQNH